MKQQKRHNSGDYQRFICFKVFHETVFEAPKKLDIRTLKIYHCFMK